MAVNTGGNNRGNRGGRSTVEEQQEQNNGGGNRYQGGGQQGGLAAIRNRFGVQFSRSPSGAAVKAYVTEFKKILEAANLNESHMILDLDGTSNGLELSLIIFSGSAKHSDGHTMVASHVKVVASSGPDLAPQTVQVYNNRNAEIAYTPGDVWNPSVRDKVLDMLALKWGGEVELLEPSVSDLPFLLKPDDEQHMYYVIAVVLEDIRQSLWQSSGEEIEPFCVDWFTNNEKINLRVDFNPTVQTPAGLPIRADISVRMTATQNTGNQPQNRNRGEVMELSIVDGYVAFHYAEPDRNTLYAQNITQRFVPDFVITNLETGALGYTPESMLLAIHTVAALQNENQWLLAFHKQNRVGAHRHRNIGALGYEVPSLLADGKPDMVDTDSNMFGNDQLHQLANHAIYMDRMMFSIQVPEHGEMSFLLSLLIDCANGVKGAYETLVIASNNVSGGRFGQEWKGGPIVEGNQRIETGFYNDEVTREPVDIRNLGYIELCTRSKGDIQTASAMERALSPFSPDDDVIKIEARQRIQREQFGESVKFTGYVRWVHFTAAYINCLVKSIQAGGFKPSQINLMQGASGVRRANLSSFTNLTTQAGSFGGAFQSGGGNVGNNGLGNQSFGGGRWYK